MVPEAPSNNSAGSPNITESGSVVASNGPVPMSEGSANTATERPDEETKADRDKRKAKEKKKRQKANQKKNQGVGDSESKSASGSALVTASTSALPSVPNSQVQQFSPQSVGNLDAARANLKINKMNRKAMQAAARNGGVYNTSINLPSQAPVGAVSIQPVRGGFLATLTREMSIEEEPGFAQNSIFSAAYHGREEDVRSHLKRRPGSVNAETATGIPLITVAAMSGQVKVIKILLEAKANILAKPVGGLTALSWAVDKDKKNVVEFILGYYLQKIESRDNNCEEYISDIKMAFFMAIRKTKHNLVAFFISKLESFYLVHAINIIPALFSRYDNLTEQQKVEKIAAAENMKTLLISELENKLATEPFQDATFIRLLGYAADASDEKVINLFQVHLQKLDPIVKEELLHLAASSRRVKTVECLIRLDKSLNVDTPSIALADANGDSADAVTPLLIAAFLSGLPTHPTDKEPQKSRDIGKILIANGADVNCAWLPAEIVDAKREESTIVPKSEVLDFKNDTPVIVDAKREESPIAPEHEESVIVPKREVLDFKNDKTVTEDKRSTVRNETGSTALILAVKNNDIEFAKMLLAAGADPNAQTLVGNTALTFATRNQNVAMVKLLLEAGADAYMRNSADEVVFAKSEEEVSFHLGEWILKDQIMDEIDAIEASLIPEFKLLVNEVMSKIIRFYFFSICMGDRVAIYLDDRRGIKKLFPEERYESSGRAVIFTKDIFGFVDEALTNMSGRRQQEQVDFIINKVREKLRSFNAVPTPASEPQQPTLPIVPAAPIVEINIRGYKTQPPKVVKDKRLENISDELDFLENFLDYRIDESSLSQIVTLRWAILGTFSQMMEKIRKMALENGHLINFPESLAEHFRNIHFHNHKLPASLLDGNIDRNLAVNKSIKDAIKVVYGFIKGQEKAPQVDEKDFANTASNKQAQKGSKKLSDQERAVLAKLDSAKLITWATHAIPPLADNSSIRFTQVNSARKALKLVGELFLKAEGGYFFSGEIIDQARGNIYAHLATYLNQRILDSLNHEPSCSSGEFALLQHIYEHRKYYAVYRHPPLGKNDSETAQLSPASNVDDISAAATALMRRGSGVYGGTPSTASTSSMGEPATPSSASSNSGTFADDLASELSDTASTSSNPSSASSASGPMSGASNRPG